MLISSSRASERAAMISLRSAPGLAAAASSMPWTLSCSWSRVWNTWTSITSERPLCLSTSSLFSSSLVVSRWTSLVVIPLGDVACMYKVSFVASSCLITSTSFASSSRSLVADSVRSLRRPSWIACSRALFSLSRSPSFSPWSNRASVSATISSRFRITRAWARRSESRSMATAASTAALRLVRSSGFSIASARAFSAASSAKSRSFISNALFTSSERSPSGLSTMPISFALSRAASSAPRSLLRAELTRAMSTCRWLPSSAALALAAAISLGYLLEMPSRMQLATCRLRIWRSDAAVALTSSSTRDCSSSRRSLRATALA
mmetsp:Transcript_3305/g.9599  ORF Transcript_3305/g.9599 Transcript_3305/m.9599 type:complete len:321 (+) Transcript_3305:2211-3173(+)